MGAEVVAINCDWDGMDINVGCGSTHLGPVTELVRASRARTWGSRTTATPIACSPVDETGAEVDGDMIMAIMRGRR